MRIASGTTGSHPPKRVRAIEVSCLKTGHWRLHALKAEVQIGTLFMPIHLVGELQIDEAVFHHGDVDEKR